LPATDVVTDRELESERLAVALREAGALALKTFRGNVRSWTKGKNSPVCEADIAVDGLLRGKLRTPGYGWLSEETEDDPTRLQARRLFIVDPIDGTRAYLAGRQDWSISAALVEDGRPVAAAVYVPVDDEMFVAIAGGGATINGAKMAASRGHDLIGAKVAGPASYLERVAALGAAITPVAKIHSLALRLTRVAQGRIDAAFASVNGHDWDLAAADLLVHEAGGKVTTISGMPLTYNLPRPIHGALLAAGLERHATMLKLLRQHAKEFA
jgi:myo-inositol-1(or 4)-monophosphatase